nr:hypothetical protein [Gemmatimonadota bacterium]NIR79761.1 hypothetical protein [Gemmatimonadota bacterium]NIT88457.1 hypothetical protein [Gemmatimonadota bacterium]NIU32280.1 hypothetical protein [Gemmatimonadota bacterium]NIU36821.1 hypothetical protein [Gemmatimonadota bacterium]
MAAGLVVAVAALLFAGGLAPAEAQGGSGRGQEGSVPYDVQLPEDQGTHPTGSLFVRGL